MPKRSLGQHFLASHAVVKKIAEAADILRDDAIVEVGPGRGAVTAELLARKARVIAFEKDMKLSWILQERFADNVASGALTVLNDDIFNLHLYMKRPSFFPQQHPYTIVGNIPYNITGKLFPYLFGLANPPSHIVVMAQKEVAERICARDGKESLLSISIKVYGTPKYIQKVPARYFRPAPRVDSALIAISNISRGRFEGIDEKKFFAVVKRGFSHKRKKLANNIPGSKKIFEACTIEPDARAENVTLAQWLCITKET